MGILGSREERQGKRAEKELRSLIAKRDSYRGKAERLSAAGDVLGLVRLIGDIERKGDAGWPLVLETARRAAAFGDDAFEVFWAQPGTKNEQQWKRDNLAWAPVLALVGGRAWDWVLDGVDRAGRYSWLLEADLLPALTYFSIFEGPHQAEARRLLDDAAEGRLKVEDGESERQWLKKQVEEVREFCSHINDPDVIDEYGRRALDIAEFNRLPDGR